MNISTADHEAIRAAIAAAEKTTCGEIFCVVTRASDDYRYVPLVWAVLAALSLPLPLILFTALPGPVIYAAQLALFLVLSLAALWWPLRIALVPRALKRRRAHRNAMEQFLAHGLHTTRGRTGVLLFVSVAEHHAEVVADEAIAAKADQGVWDNAVSALIAGAKKDQLGQGFVNAISLAGAVLAVHFPADSTNNNELPDHLVVL